MKYRNTTINRPLHAAVLTLAILAYSLSAANAYAADDDWYQPNIVLPTDVRVLSGTGEFTDVRSAAFAYRIPVTQRFGIDRFELASGVISDDDDGRLFASFGPVWHLPLGDGRTFTEFGLSPTFVGGSSFGDRDLGGNFHFTSSLALGTTLGAHDNFSVSIRAQHTSNAGLRNHNPGLDLFGINFSYQFGR